MSDSHKDDVDFRHRAEGDYPILSQRGTASNRQWRAVADEAGTFLQLLAKLEQTATDALERERFEEQIVASLTRLAVRSSSLCDVIEKTFGVATGEGGVATDKGGTGRQSGGPAADPFVESLSRGKGAARQIEALLQNFSISSEQMTEEISTHLTSLDIASRSRGPDSTRRLRSAAHEAATAMTGYADELAINIPPFRRSVASIGETFTALRPWLKENQPDKRVAESLRAPLGELKQPVGQAIKSTSTFHDRIAEPKGVTRELTRARSRLARLLLTLLESLWEFEVLRIEFLSRFEAGSYPAR
ncbi:MAG: hypothetical protein JSV66_13145 [Trueperaceae bacterium]|nr:MAG: hypothetical protein JSV66_13145 [Trueperaceae bacterium]